MSNSNFCIENEQSCKYKRVYSAIQVNQSGGTQCRGEWAIYVCVSQ